jgi:hypothetical protein
MLRRTVEESEDVSDAESFDSLNSRAKFMFDMLSDSDSTFSDGRNSMNSISTYGPVTPRTPSPEYMEHGFIEIHDEKSPRSRAQSMEISPTFAMKVKEMTTVGPRGPHLFRSYSTSHSHNIAHIQIPPPPSAMPPTPSLTETSRSPASIYAPSRHSHASHSPSIGSQHSDSEPIVVMRPRSEMSPVTQQWDIEEVRGWSPNQVCSWMVALGFDTDLVEKFAKNDITGSILIDLKWDDLKEVC